VTKTCATCEKSKPLTEFGVRKNRQGRLFPYRDCRSCMNAARRANVELRERAQARQQAARASKSAELAISTEISALIRATTSRRKTTPPPLPTAEELAAWHREGCLVAPHQRRRAAA
jgi:hypothetical protein